MNWFKKKRIFLDYASATPVLSSVKEEMDKYWSRDFYNPSAIYEEGRIAKEALSDYRIQIAKLLGIGHKNLTFTSGGTESVNLAILGAFEVAFKEFKKPHLIISSIEHASVMRSAEEVKKRGGEVSFVPVNDEGQISLDVLKSLIKKNTFLVSVSLANSEIGTVAPLAKIGRLIREYKKANQTFYPYLHTDASQAPNYLPVALETLQVDLLTLDGSKIYGPRGIGILATRAGVKLRPIIFGGEQEGGLRAGTANLPLVAGFAKAFELAVKDHERESKRLEELRKYFTEGVVKNIPKAVINGSLTSHLPNIVSVSLPGTLSELILLKLDLALVSVSVGTACSYDERESGSPVIKALGKFDLAESTLRFSFGRFTEKKDLKEALEIFCRIAKM